MTKDLSVSSLIAGFVAVLIGFTGSVALIFEATHQLSASPEQTASWLWALGIGIGVGSIGLSLATRQPVMIAWSTAGAGVIASAAAEGGITMPEAIGAFMVSALLITLSGVTGWFEKIMNRLPVPLAAALLAGVLARFALDAFAAVPSNPWLVLVMFGAFLVGRIGWPRFNVPVMLLSGIVVAMFQGLFHLGSVEWGITTPVWVTPHFSMKAVVGIAIPLFVVTMASQNLPGVSIFLAHGYKPPVSRIIGWSGFTNLLVAPFGGYALNLAAITAAFCLGPEAHPDPRKRYPAAIFAGLFYALIGVFGATIVALFNAFPRELILAVAGFGLLGTITNGLTLALNEERYRVASIVTFFVTLSGVMLLGISSAFWGMIAGAVVLLLKPHSGR
ncbi:benzoate/H(+) symporter BenE family transporter [Luteolibacter sp. SL250]|uniref:benzoate/H(+) symporter BenE family transporter n=1 Tax=Luteolibacter sp. SL250 TaxID=2995170 RepID=UPI00226E0BD9|nr:benzoate/H(+) symporter BenE family transporter [Luteolibacter sp. SL250]WAC19595.1 benzoate/H(+) symporter BenE family transporter [Luteolibacter sp. SL250]